MNVYLPKDTWYNFYTKMTILSSGSFFVITAPPDTIPLIIRGGYILPTQIPDLTTTLRLVILNSHLFILLMVIKII